MTTLLGKRIKMVRGDRSQKEFGELLGVSRSTIASYESGVNQPSIELLIKIARLGPVSMDWLTGNTQHTSYPVEVLFHNPHWQNILSLANEKNINPQVLLCLINDCLNISAPQK